MIGQNSVGQAGLAGLALDETGTAVLDMVLEPVLVCEPVLVDDRVVDLRIGYVNPAAAVSGRVSGSGVSGSGGGHAGRGRSFLELYPESAGNGLFEACLDVLTTGTQVDLTGLGLATPAGETGRGSGSGRSDELGTGRELFDVRIARHRRGVLIAWMPTADQVSRIDPGAGNP